MFKQIITATLAAITFASTPVQAKDIAWMGNNSGGRIVIQGYKCPWQGWGDHYQAYTTTPNGRTMMGCYWLERATATVHVTWEGGERYSYTAGRFTMYEY